MAQVSIDWLLFVDRLRFAHEFELMLVDDKKP